MTVDELNKEKSKTIDAAESKKQDKPSSSLCRLNVQIADVYRRTTSKVNLHKSVRIVVGNNAVVGIVTIMYRL
jgi:hypothetical protein